MSNNLPAKFESASAVMRALKEETENLQRMLPSHAKNTNVEALVSSVALVVAQNKYLLECPPASLVRAAYSAARVGLPLDPQLKLAYIVPRKGQATFVPSYRGIVSLLKRSGAVDFVQAEVVYEKDYWEIKEGFPPEPVHKPNFEVDDRGKPIAAYAIAYKNNNIVGKVWMTRSEILKRMNENTMKEKTVWKKWEADMWKKTAILQLPKYMPLDPETTWAFESTIDREGGMNVIEGPVSEDDIDAIEAEYDRVNETDAKRLNEMLSQEETKAPPTDAQPDNKREFSKEEKNALNIYWGVSGMQPNEVEDFYINECQRNLEALKAINKKILDESKPEHAKQEVPEQSDWMQPPPHEDADFSKGGF